MEIVIKKRSKIKGNILLDFFNDEKIEENEKKLFKYNKNVKKPYINYKKWLVFLKFLPVEKGKKESNINTIKKLQKYVRLPKKRKLMVFLTEENKFRKVDKPTESILQSLKFSLSNSLDLRSILVTNNTKKTRNNRLQSLDKYLLKKSGINKDIFHKSIFFEVLNKKYIKSLYSTNRIINKRTIETYLATKNKTKGQIEKLITKKERFLFSRGN